MVSTLDDDVTLNDSFDTREHNMSYSQNNVTSYVFYVSVSDQRFRHVVNEMEVYWIPIIFVLGMYIISKIVSLKFKLYFKNRNKLDAQIAFIFRLFHFGIFGIS